MAARIQTSDKPAPASFLNIRAINSSRDTIENVSVLVNGTSVLRTDLIPNMRVPFVSMYTVKQSYSLEVKLSNKGKKYAETIKDLDQFVVVKIEAHSASLFMLSVTTPEGKSLSAIQIQPSE